MLFLERVEMKVLKDFCGITEAIMKCHVLSLVCIAWQYRDLYVSMY